MQGSWNNDKPHYRCVYPTEYALANHTHHPRSLYLREEQIVPTLDRWLLRHGSSLTALASPLVWSVRKPGGAADDGARELSSRDAHAEALLHDVRHA